MEHDYKQVVSDFLANSVDRLAKIRNESKTAVSDFGECVEFYGEERQQTDTTGFFSALLKFIRAYKQAETDLEQRNRMSSRNQSPTEAVNRVTGKRTQVIIVCHYFQLLSPAKLCAPLSVMPHMDVCYKAINLTYYCICTCSLI